MKYNRYKVFGFALVSMVAFSACSDSFLDDKKNYDNVNPDVYNYYEGANARVNDVYSWCLPNTGGAIGWQYPSTGSNDAEGMSTEEYSGFGSFVDPQAEMSVSKGNMPDYFYGQLNNIQQSAYGRIRNINDVIAGITGSTLSDDEKNELLGQVYFFRAWCYFRLVQWFGGVPLVTGTRGVGLYSALFGKEMHRVHLLRPRQGIKDARKENNERRMEFIELRTHHHRNVRGTEGTCAPAMVQSALQPQQRQNTLGQRLCRDEGRTRLHQGLRL